MARQGGKDRGITYKEGKWWVRLFNNGREKWYRAENKTQAKTLYGRLKAEIREGTYFPEKFEKPKDITLRVWILRCVESSTNRGVVNERRYGRRWSLLLGRRLLNQITTEDLRRIQARMQAQRIKAQQNPKATKKSKRVWSAATINRHFAFLRRVLTLAVKDGKLDRNPVTGIKFFPEAKRTRYFTDKELTQLQNYMQPVEWKLIAFAIESGLRREEQFSLRWDQVCFESSVITLPLPKGGKTRHVPLSDGAKGILRSLSSFVDSPWVFPSPKNPLKYRNAQTFVNDFLSPALRKLGITGACWHTLRHTAASRRVMAGVDLLAVKEILGHRDITTTLRYSHLSPGYLQDAVNRGSLVGTGSKTGSSPDEGNDLAVSEETEIVETKEKERWLGEKDSNPHSQNQNPNSPQCD